MRKVTLRTIKQNQYEIIKDLVDHNGNKLRAAYKLGITIRQVNRLIITYKEKEKYIPPITHSFKGESFRRYLALKKNMKIVLIFKFFKTFS